MQLHADAALSLNQLRRMVRRVIEDGWSLTEAAEVAEISERTCSKWVARCLLTAWRVAPAWRRGARRPRCAASPNTGGGRPI